MSGSRKQSPGQGLKWHKHLVTSLHKGHIVKNSLWYAALSEDALPQNCAVSVCATPRERSQLGTPQMYVLLCKSWVLNSLFMCSKKKPLLQKGASAFTPEHPSFGRWRETTCLVAVDPCAVTEIVWPKKLICFQLPHYTTGFHATTEKTVSK
jgi:hypothetical protein